MVIKMTNETKKERTWTNDEWTTATEPLNEWIQTHKNNEDMEDTIDSLKLNIKRGKKNESKRAKAWASMLLEMRGIDDSPIGGKGAQSTLPQSVQTTLKTIREALVQERQLAFGSMTSKIVVRRSGKGDEKQTFFYNNALEEATSWANGRIASLKKEYNNDEWDGTIEGLNDRVSTVEEAKSDDS
jgi:hypothetical protein